MSKASDDFTIFYAWQSDTNQNHSRYLINEALIEATNRLNESKDFPFRVVVDSDTAGATGLCDIPATILRKIEAADAAVVDMTYVACSAGDDPTRCPNPNVLFELGYGFHAIGPERLICVMNTLHGAADDMLFDIAHRRWPIVFASPVIGKNRQQVVNTLADELEPAVRAIVRLGPRTLGVDDNREFLREKAEIETHWQSGAKSVDQWATVQFTIHPKRFRELRWGSDDQLEELIQSHLVRGHDGSYPPNRRYTDAMPWGIYNAAYGHPFWALTYSGQFWAAYRLNPDYAFPHRGVTNIEEVDSEREDEDYPRKVAAGGWIDFQYSTIYFLDLFKFAGSLASIYSPHEIIVWHCRADGIGGKRIVADDGSLFRHASRMCAAPYAQAGNQVEAADFSKSWIESCADFCHQLFGKFDILGQRPDRPKILQRLQRLNEPGRR